MANVERYSEVSPILHRTSNAIAMLLYACMTSKCDPISRSRVHATIVASQARIARRSCHVNDSDPALLAEAHAFLEAHHGVQLRRVYSPSQGSRTHSRVGVRAASSGMGVVVGMFEEGTHNIVPCHLDARCHLPHHPAINQAIDLVIRELAEFQELSAYDEASGKGTIRHLQIRVETSTGRVQLTFVANMKSLDNDPALLRFASRLWARYSGPSKMSLELHSIWVNLSIKRSIMSYEDGAWHMLHASGNNHKSQLAYSGSLIEKLPSGASMVLPPYVFRQANLEGFDQIVSQVRSVVTPQSKVVEWYAGIGVIGLSLVQDCEWVRCSDIKPPRAAFEASKALLETSQQSRITYRVGSASELIEDARGANVAVVDPPRKGLDEGLLDALCSSEQDSACAGLQTLVYISCGFRALQHDMERLLRAGWRVRGNEANAYVLFFGADHIETVMVFDRHSASNLKNQNIFHENETNEVSASSARPVKIFQEANAKTLSKPQQHSQKEKRNPNSPRARRRAANIRKFKENKATQTKSISMKRDGHT